MFQAAKAELLTFGKYRGKTLGDVFVEDPQYIMWLAKSYDGRNQERTARLKYYKDLYFETITKKNKNESNSKFVGKVGEKIVLEADIYNVVGEHNNFNGNFQYRCKLVDKDGNKYLTYNIGTKVKKGDSVKMTAKIKKHQENLGVKFTLLYYCKVQTIFNLEEDINKFNL